VPVDLEVNSDRGRLKVVLNNLVGNSLKYNDANKEEKLVELKTSYQNNSLVIQVNDNGIGIAEEHQPKIFDMFYRATERSQGSGLGLYIAKETIEKLGGKISLTSKVGQGTNFSVAIPTLMN
jgi:signal transduction histidine kinase